MDDDNYKSFDDMTEWEKEEAIYSARYILEDASIKKIADATGLPEGVISAAFKNIFVN